MGILTRKRFTVTEWYNQGKPPCVIAAWGSGVLREALGHLAPRRVQASPIGAFGLLSHGGNPTTVLTSDTDKGSFMHIQLVELAISHANVAFVSGKEGKKEPFYDSFKKKGKKNNPAAMFRLCFLDF